MDERSLILNKAVSYLVQMAMVNLRVELNQFDNLLTTGEMSYIKQQLIAVGEIEEGNDAPRLENLDDTNQVIQEYILMRENLYRMV